MRVSIPRISTAVPLRCQELVPWLPLEECGDIRAGYETKVKIGYDESAIHFFMACQDRILSCTSRPDFDDLFLEDVVELFLWPDQSMPLYFEYELSPLGAELVLLVPNHKGTFMGWRPWHYHDERLVHRTVEVLGGEAAPGAAVEGWNASMSIPFQLLKGLGNVPPKSGTVWRGNVYRMDYDRPGCAKWAINPVTDGQFHNYWEFAEFVFE